MIKTEKVDKISLPVPRLLDLHQETRDILLLHFKQGMTYGAVAHIFSLTLAEVEQICTKFASVFSTRENLMNVIESMSKVSRKSKALSEAVIGCDDRDVEITDLRKRLAEAELKAELYQEMVRVAELTYKIPIRKKFGAK